MRRETDTILMLSDTSFTTHASSAFRGLTETGSIPTGISAIRTGLFGFEISKTARRASGALTANNGVPSGETRTGLTCFPSKLTRVCAGQSKGDAHNSTAMRAKDKHRPNEFIQSYK